MSNSKSILASKTFWGAVLGLIGTAFPHLGLSLGSADADQLAGLFSQLIGFGLVLYGRWNASKALHVIAPPEAPKQ